MNRDPNGPDRNEELRRSHRADVAAGVLAHAKRLRWKKERIDTERQTRLRELLAHAIEHSPFHAERLEGVDPAVFTESDLSSLPVMTKEDLMSEYSWVLTDPRLSLEVVENFVAHVKDDEYLLERFHAVTSSGSSGRRGVYVYDWDEWTTLALMQSRSRWARPGISPGPREARRPVCSPVPVPISPGSCAHSWPSPTIPSATFR